MLGRYLSLVDRGDKVSWLLEFTLFNTGPERTFTAHCMKLATAAQSPQLSDAHRYDLVSLFIPTQNPIKIFDSADEQVNPAGENRPADDMLHHPPPDRHIKTPRKAIGVYRRRHGQPWHAALLHHRFDQIRALGRQPGFKRQFKRFTIVHLYGLDPHGAGQIDELQRGLI